MPALRVFQSLWAMGCVPSRDAQWTLEEQLGRIAAAGFDGVAIDDDHPSLEEAVCAARALGLEWSASVFPRSTEQLVAGVERLTPLGPAHLNVQPDVRPACLDEAVALFGAWQRVFASAPYPVSVETHRGRATTDLPFTLELLDRLPGLELTADVSHYVVGQEMELPVLPAYQRQIRAILDRARAFHGRVASCEQVQVPFSLPHNEPWLALFLGWWKVGFRSWLDRFGDEDACLFVVELGPPPYAITGSGEIELSDRWQESLQLLAAARECWRAVAPGEATADRRPASSEA